MKKTTGKINSTGKLAKLRSATMNAAEDLFPGYFALVMATGVVSIACYLLGFPSLAYLLVGINWLAYLVLWLLTLLRLFFYPKRLLGDLSDHQCAPGFLTIVAGTCVLGTQSAIVLHADALAGFLWYLGLGLWAIVMYSLFTAVTISENKPPLAVGLNGAWLIAVVATQSVVVLHGALGPGTVPFPAVQFLCLAMFMIGCMLYLAIIPLILYRLTFKAFASQDFSPPYWINMGAVAITTLAGSILLMRANDWTLLQDLIPFLKGFTLFFWAVASWWIPLLLSLMVWRYLVRRDRLTYDPQLWGMVFPLGMYTTATYQLSRALDLKFLAAIPESFIFLAIAAWLATFGGLLIHLARAAYTMHARHEPT